MKYNRFGFWMTCKEWRKHSRNILCFQFFWVHFHSWADYKFPYIRCRFIKSGNYPKKFIIYSVFAWKAMTRKEAIIDGHIKD